MKFQSIRIKVTFLAICLASSLCSYADQTILLLQSEKQTDLLLVQSKKLIPLLKSTNYLQASEAGKIIYQVSENSPWQCAELSWSTDKFVLVPLETPSELTNQDVFPTFSPDGAKLFWIRYGDGKCVLHIWNFATKSYLPSKEIAGYAYLPAWSPDGSKLAFYLKEKSPDFLIDDYGFAVFDIMKNEIRKLPVSQRTRLSPQRDRRPSWSNNSQYVFYEGKYEFSKGHFQVLLNTATGKLHPCDIGIWINDSDLIYAPPENEFMSLYFNRLNNVLNGEINLDKSMGKVNTPYFSAYTLERQTNTLYFQSDNHTVFAYHLNGNKEVSLGKVDFNIQTIVILINK